MTDLGSSEAWFSGTDERLDANGDPVVMAPKFNERCSCPEAEVMLAQGCHENSNTGTIVTYASFLCPACGHEYVIETNELISEPAPTPDPVVILDASGTPVESTTDRFMYEHGKDNPTSDQSIIGAGE